MSVSPVRLNSSASPLMIVASASLHAVALTALIAFSATVFVRTPPKELPATQVKLVEVPRGVPVMETVDPYPEAAAKTPAADDSAQPETAGMPEDPVRHTIAKQTSSLPSPEKIPLKKRSSEPKRIDSTPKEKPRPEKAKTVEDPKALLEKRLAAIRENVGKNKAGESDTDKGKKGAASPGIQGQKQGAGALDPEIARWFDSVRKRVNSHWSILGDSPARDKMTIIGVKIRDNGKLLDATVDEGSGDQTFDRSALRAVFGADPFPPVPEQLREKIREAGGLALRFTPGGMQ